MATAPLLAPQVSFYKRPLPPSCIAFNSHEGKRLFAKALGEGNMEGYFTLAGSLEMQSEAAYCGLATLCSILNALEVDPQRQWKGAWRWYDQNMLDCARPLELVAQSGISLAEFTCLARCNGLTARVTSPLLDSKPEERDEAIQRFREDVRSAARGKGAIAISYSRKTLGQTGDGHFSPIGGYCEAEDKVLLLDVARFKYPAYWLPIELAWDSMLPLDKATGLPRGYVLLDVASFEAGSLSAPLSLTSLALNKTTWSNLSRSLSKLLLQSSKTSPPPSPADLIALVLTHLHQLLTPALSPRPKTDSREGALGRLLGGLSRTGLAREAAGVLNLPSPSPSATTDASLASAPLLPPQTLLNLLLLLSLFSPRSSLTALIPPSASSGLQALMREALETAEGVREEVEVVTKQMGALGECCRSEEDAGAACGCLGGPKV